MGLTMRTTDNNCGKQLGDLEKSENESYTIADLQKIANVAIDKIKLDDHPNLLVFPREWNKYHDDVQNSSIFTLSADEKLTTQNIMGFVGINDTQLTISSRFAPDGTDYFLHYMLQKVFSVNIVNFDIQGHRIIPLHQSGIIGARLIF
ncbi:hypothetical protein FACS1894200_09580 [Spirochaetia bacterium]|nr:hypothetical protein FACS1894200_09580 [Spirochaetia bacterium]